MVTWLVLGYHRRGGPRLDIVADTTFSSRQRAEDQDVVHMDLPDKGFHMMPVVSLTGRLWNTAGHTRSMFQLCIAPVVVDLQQGTEFRLVDDWKDKLEETTVFPPAALREPRLRIVRQDLIKGLKALKPKA